LEDTPGKSLGHLDAAEYQLNRYNICEGPVLSEAIFIARKKALESVLQGTPIYQHYFGLTEGLLMPRLGLFSKQFFEMEECLKTVRFAELTSSSTGICN